MRARTLWLLVCLLFWPVTARAETAYLPLIGSRFLPHTVTWATVTKVVDGDTVWIDLDKDGRGDAKVRYLGIDTPETYFGVECYGPEAKERNRELVGGQRVALQRDVSDLDCWDRLLRYVYLGDGTWVNGDLVREGYARVTIYAPDDRYEAALYALQERARGENAGGWAACGW